MRRRRHVGESPLATISTLTPVLAWTVVDPVALSADGSTIAVGAFGEASAATGIGGDQTDNTSSSSGAV